MTSKLRVKLGRIELEFEGSEDFIKQELMAVLAQVKTLGAAVGALDDHDDDDADDGNKKPEKKKVDGELTTSTIAAKLGVDSGSELVVAAMARLSVVGNATKVTRKQITAEMRLATAYFKENYVSNLSKQLKTLITSQRLNDLGSSTYSLSATERAALETKLASA